MVAFRVMISLIPLLAISDVWAKDGVVVLNTKKTHLSIALHKGLSGINFYKNRNFEGHPFLRLDQQGLFVEKKMVCSWPGKQFSASKSHSMVLGYSSLKFLKPNGKYRYTSCPKELPVKSTWGDGGIGSAALYIEVERINDNIAVTKAGDIALYLSLKPLKGKYRIEPPAYKAASCPYPASPINWVLRYCAYKIGTDDEVVIQRSDCFNAASADLDSKKSTCEIKKLYKLRYCRTVGKPDKECLGDNTIEPFVTGG